MKKTLSVLFGLAVLASVSLAVPLGQGLGDVFPAGIKVTNLATLDGITLTTVSTTQGNVSSGVYTPTLTNTTNIAASTAHSMSWVRIGNIVTCSFNVNIDPIAAVPTATTLTFTLPIACSTTPTIAGAAQNNAPQSGIIYPNNATTALYLFNAVSVDDAIHVGTFQYILN